MAIARELAISLYLFAFRIFFFKLLPQKDKTTFVSSFGDNAVFILQELEKHSNQHMIILKTDQCKVHYVSSSTRTIIQFIPKKIFAWLRSIYHLATSRHVFVDNYYGFLAVTPFKKGTTCVQLWHAAGGPRTDFFFNERRVSAVKSLMHQDFPITKEKKVLMYAPTYRDDALEVDSIALDLDRLHEELHEEYVLFLRLHPVVSGTLTNKYSDFIKNVSNYPNINHLLLITDVLISDYSSIPFEFALLNKPMIFFAYDLKVYEESRGFWRNYVDVVPGPVVETNETLIEAIQEENYNMEAIQESKSFGMTGIHILPGNQANG